jgi:hypothetical protein
MFQYPALRQVCRWTVYWESRIHSLTAVGVGSGYLGHAACRSRDRQVYRLVIFEGLSSLFTPIRGFPQEHFQPGLRNGLVPNDPLTMRGMFVCLPQQFTLGTGFGHHVNRTSAPSFSRT